jgi:hypothetical protein
MGTTLNKVIQRQLVRWGTDLFAGAGGDGEDAHAITERRRN